MRQVAAFSAVLIAYALAMAFIGWLTWRVAPPGANALTAAIIPGAGAAISLACAVLLLRVTAHRGQARAGLWIGLILPIVMGAGAASRLPKSLSADRAFHSASSQVTPDSPASAAESATDPGAVPTSATRPSHSTGYQAVGLGAVTALSALAMVSLIGLRPRLPEASRTDNPEPARNATLTPSSPAVPIVAGRAPPARDDDTVPSPD